MSQEPKPQKHEYPVRQARILDIEPAEDGGVTFRIDETADGNDLLTTLLYLQPDHSKVDMYLDAILESGINGKIGNVMSNRRVRVDDSTLSSTPNARIERLVVFGEDPSYEDVTQVFNAVYGNEEIARQKKAKLTLALVDSGHFRGKIVQAPSNEISRATDQQIAAAMAQLTNELYGFGEPPVIE